MRIISTGSQNGNCYVLCSDDKILFLDCGCNFKKILQGINFQISKVVGCLLSHEHGDHSKAYKDFLKSGIPIYASDETEERFDVIAGERMIGKQERMPFKCGTFTVTPFYLPHTTKHQDTGKIIPCPNFGYMVQYDEMGTLLYMTDMEYCPYSFKNIRPQHLVIECNYVDELIDREQSNYEHRIQGHCSLETCKGIIKTNMTPALRTVTLIHLSDLASNDERILNEVQDITGDQIIVNIAKPGLNIDLNKFPF